MLFSEIYSNYFNAVAEILSQAVAGKLTGKKMRKIVEEKAFHESVMIIPDALQNGEWPLLTKEMKTPLKNEPTQPLTLIQKRWMKSILLDPKIHLFEPDFEGLQDVEPLYTPNMFVYFDRYEDGDPYTDETYINNFRTILKALENGDGLTVHFRGRTGLIHERTGLPDNLEYSVKDDKFRLRLLPSEGKYKDVLEINLARIISCKFAKVSYDDIEIPREKTREQVTLELVDERNALDRAMRHFSYMEKETRQISENRYQVTIYYDKNDETELLIQILSFGPLLSVIGPEHFRMRIRERIKRQKAILNKE